MPAPTALIRPDVGINGYSGFARIHRRITAAAEAAGLCRYRGFADYGVIPLPEDESNLFRVPDLAALVQRLAQPGLVTSPSPIHFHGSDHETIVSAGHACYLEKPPTLAPCELEAMRIRDLRAPFPTAVGFQYMAGSFRRNLKQRLVAGEFGELKSVSFLGMWQRDRDYYRRASWPGRLQLNGRWVLDSPFGNACAHFFHAALCWAAVDAVWKWADIAEVTAALYRANAIEGADTLFAEALTTRGVKLRFATSHACQDHQTTVETITCSRATLSLKSARSVQIHWQDGKEEIVSWPKEDLEALSLSAYLQRLADPENGPEIVTLGDCRSFVELNGLFYVAAGSIHPVLPAFQYEEKNAVIIPNIAEAGLDFVEKGEWPDSNRFPWAHPPGKAAAAESERLPDVISSLFQEAQATLPDPGSDREENGEADSGDVPESGLNAAGRCENNSGGRRSP